MARFGRSTPTPHQTHINPALAVPTAPVSVTVTARSAVLPHVGPTSTVTPVAVLSATVTAYAAVLPHVGPTAALAITTVPSRPRTSVGFIPI